MNGFPIELALVLSLTAAGAALAVARIVVDNVRRKRRLQKTKGYPDIRQTVTEAINRVIHAGVH